MIVYNEGDLHKYPLFKSILKKLGSDEISDQEVWSEAKGHNYPPNMANILYRLSAERIQEEINDKIGDDDIDIEFSSYINARDTHISINGDEINDLDDFVQAFTINGGTF